MRQRVFVKVVGFTDVERHALNTVFRLSEQARVNYVPWEPSAPEPPRMLLVDGLHPEAGPEVEAARRAQLPFTWVGPRPPRGAWQVFMRPLAWPEVVMSLDELFLPAPVLDIDIEGDAIDTHPTLLMEPGGPPCRALLVGSDPLTRMYLRAKLALALWTLADEAEGEAVALEMARGGHYELAVLDLAPGTEPWPLVAELRRLQPGLRGVLMIQPRPSWLLRARARLHKVVLMRKPPHPGRLHELLGRLRFLPEAG